jgi:hypothetical protein
MPMNTEELTYRVAQLESLLEGMVALQDTNFRILQHSVALRSVENSVLRRIVSDVHRELGSVPLFRGGSVYLTPQGEIDFARYEGEYIAMQGLQGALEVYKERQAKLAPEEEPDADYVFGG